MDKTIPAAQPAITDEELCSYVALAPEPKRILEDYRPVWNSLDLRLARAFWRERGVGAFLDGEVPYGATCGGRLADDAARVLLLRLAETGHQGPVHLLEIGAGSGVFAKIMLDRLAALEPDVYAATQFVVTDGAESMLAGMRDLRLIEAHGGRVLQARVDATRPLAAQLAAAGAPTSGYHGVFANYLLDSLPFSIRAYREEKAWELEVRTGLADEVDLDRYFDGDLDQLRAALQTLGEGSDPRLSNVHKALVLDARYAPAPRKTAPFPETLPPPAADSPSPLTTVSLDNHGAIALLDQLTAALAQDGLILFTDYGRSEEPEPGEHLDYQRFGGSAAVGLNFAQVDRWAAAREGVYIAKPGTDPYSLMTRAVTRAPSQTMASALEAICSAARIDALQAPLEAARQLAKSHQFEAARWRYEEALYLQPCNWNALEEIALFLISIAGDPDAGLALTARALELNPASPGAYRLMGRALWEKGERDKAEAAYRRSLELSPADGSARIDLAEALLARRRHSEALAQIADGLAGDIGCEYRDDFLEMQDRVLKDMTLQAKDDLMRSANRLRRHRALPGGGEGPEKEE